MNRSDNGGRPTLAITMGDIAGIGPEIVAKSLAHASVYERSRPLVIGDEGALREALEIVGSDLELHRVESPEQGRYEPGVVDLLQPGDDAVDAPRGEVSEVAGDKSVEFIKKAAALGKAGEVQGIVTAPLNKAAMHRAGHLYPGHTELLAELFDVEDFSLVLTAQDRYFLHITTHVALREAVDLVTTERTLATIRLANTLAEAVGHAGDTIAVTGLNPHASEGGLFGHEDQDQLTPAVEQAQAEGINAVGPLPADALIPQAVKGRYRFVIVCYHDQGHAPFKAVYGDEGVNITVGLPVVRTSVDHGTAFDIAGEGIASEESLLAALELAVQLAPHWPKIHEAMRRFSAA
jgi:4-phospho-D-threonate 3-dehydrogenase / 4-phospho-D-erythronate 3-dehydrogenase